MPSNWRFEYLNKLCKQLNLIWKAINSVIQVDVVYIKSLNLHVNVKFPCRRRSDLKVICCISEYRGHDTNKKNYQTL